MIYLPVPVNSFLWLYSNLFKYVKTIDFTTSHTNCEHSIECYMTRATKHGYVSSLIKRKNPRFNIPFPEPGLYSVTGTVVAACPNPHPNTHTIAQQVEVTDDDLVIRRFLKEYGKGVWRKIEAISTLYVFIEIIKDIIGCHGTNQRIKNHLNIKNSEFEKTFNKYKRNYNSS